MNKPLFEKIDCLMLRVANVDDALRFYRDRLGHELLWRHGDDCAAVKLGESELVLNAKCKEPEIDIKVASAVEAADQFSKAGGEILAGPFDIRIGKCVVVKDPWGNRLILLDTTKGVLRTDDQGNVID